MIKETHEKDASTIYSVSYLLYHYRAALAHKYPKKKKYSRRILLLQCLTYLIGFIYICFSSTICCVLYLKKHPQKILFRLCPVFLVSDIFNVYDLCLLCINDVLCIIPIAPQSSSTRQETPPKNTI